MDPGFVFVFANAPKSGMHTDILLLTFFILSMAVITAIGLNAITHILLGVSHLHILKLFSLLTKVSYAGSQ
jgi:hypothetical protein